MFDCPELFWLGKYRFHAAARQRANRRHAATSCPPGDTMRVRCVARKASEFVLRSLYPNRRAGCTSRVFVGLLLLTLIPMQTVESAPFVAAPGAPRYLPPEL